MSLITEFDPWRSTLCTCPPKLTFNPYVGCDHSCIYCYASSYIQRFSDCRPKKDLIPRLRKEAARLKGEIVSIANSSDPYPNLEGEMRLTRACLNLLSKQDCKIQLITKSDLVVRDIDLLKKAAAMVSLTITTIDDHIAGLAEPRAPLASERLRALELLIDEGIPASVRIDPIIPFVNDKPASLIRTLANIGVQHITCSTYKADSRSWKQLSATMPKVAKKLRPLYFENGEKMGRYTCLRRDIRAKLLGMVGAQARKHGMKFGTCREGLGHLNTAPCDGSWLLNKQGSKVL